MGGRGLMPTIHPDLSIPELIKHIKHSFRESEYDEVQKTLIEREKNMKIEIENLTRDRDLLKKENDLLENTQSYTELEKCSVEEKLGMSQRRCEELDKEIVQMVEKIRIIRHEKLGVEEKLKNSNRKCEEMDERLLKMGREIEDLTLEKFDANQTMEEWKWEEIDAEEKIRILMRKKLDLEEKLENSNRKCEEMDERLFRMGREIEELRREKFDANQTIEELKQKGIEADRSVQELNCKNVEASQTIDELRVQKIESDNAAEVYKSRVGDSYKKILKLETRLSKMLSVNVEDFPNLVNGTDNCAAPSTDSEEEENVNVLNFVEGGSHSLENGMVNADGDAMSPKVCATCDYSAGSGGIGLSKKGGINLAHPGTKEDGANVVCTCSCSVPAYNSDVSESSGTIPDNEGQEPEVEVAKLIVEDSPVVEKREKLMQTKMVLEDPAVGEKRKRLISEEEEKKEKRKTGHEVKKEKKSKIGEKDEDEMKGKSNVRIGATRKWVSNMASPPDSNLENEAPCRPLPQLIGQIDWIRYPLQRLKPNVLIYVKSEICGTIKSILHDIGSDDAVQMFRSGCFGYFLDFTGGGIARKALHALMSREVRISDPSLERRECWFYINGRVLRFGPCEFNLVSGLRFGNSSFDPNVAHHIPERGIYYRLFQGKRTTIAQMLDKFSKKTLANHPPDYVKVANILFVYRMLFCIDPNRMIENWVWALVEDVDEWNSFPWGAYSFQMLMHFISLVPKSRAVMGGPQSGAYHFYGPIWTLQIWACEVIPQLGRQCGVVSKQLTMPRCLRWSFTRPLVDFSTFFEGSLEVVLMGPSSDEVMTPYYQSVQKGNILGVKYVVLRKASKKKLLLDVASRMLQVPMTCAATNEVIVGPSQPQRALQTTHQLIDEPVVEETPDHRAPQMTHRHIDETEESPDKRSRLVSPLVAYQTKRMRRSQSLSNREHVWHAGESSEDWFEQLAQRVAHIVEERVTQIFDETMGRHL